ncbi:MAG: hypothetical protein DHS20C14_04260 [Phycisphaeraceae bacterium]|nr:MAG: hypothetical protein DHS20C14_04260 [Phycisphaeraceae bacterium]
MIFTLLGGIVGVAIGALIATLILLLAAKIVVKDVPAFGDGYKACFVAGLIVFVLNLIVGLAFANAPMISMLASLAIFVGGFFAYMFMIQKYCGYTTGQSAGVAGVMYAFFILITIVIVGVLIAMGIGMSAAGGP